MIVENLVYLPKMRYLNLVLIEKFSRNLLCQIMGRQYRVCRCGHVGDRDICILDFVKMKNKAIKGKINYRSNVH
jgi:hypothetical protein